MKMKNEMIYKYCGETKELLAITTIDDLIDNNYSSKQISNIINYALKGSKGYGYIDGYYWSYKEVKILTPSEEVEYFMKYMNDIYETFKSQNERLWYYDYDNYMEAIMMTIDAINEGKHINIYEPYIRLKMSGIVKNEITRFNNDSVAVVKEYTFDMQDISNDDNFHLYGKYIIDDREDVFEYDADNKQLLIDLLYHYIDPYFTKEVVDMWIEYKMRDGKNYHHIAKKYGYKNGRRFKVVMDKIDKHLNSVKDILLDNYDTLKVNDFENMTLKDF